MLGMAHVCKTCNTGSIPVLVSMTYLCSMCTHENFVANVKVNRLTEEDEVTIKGFSADIVIQCHECGQAFEFVGVEPGLSPFGPRCSIDSTQLRAPIKPATGQLAFESEHVKLN